MTVHVSPQALQQSKQDVPEELKELAAEFKAKVERNEARYAGSGFTGKGFKFDENEKTEAQKIADMEKRQYEIEQGLVPTDDITEDVFDEGM